MSERFAIRFGFWKWLLALLGMGPGVSDVETGPRELRVRMGWGFRTTIPASSVSGVHRDRDMWWGIGVHGWAGRWLVNGSVRGIVRIEVDPPARAWVIGVPVRLRELFVSLDDPDGFVAALSSREQVG